MPDKLPDKQNFENKIKSIKTVTNLLTELRFVWVSVVLWFDDDVSSAVLMEKLHFIEINFFLTLHAYILLILKYIYI